ncbi:hypothetical protein Pse7367_2376 [Thalassoporum mexicanum PCC 7367]|uniref:AAA family ATPase n=1 Tax=Thalassoporum mexicanum TaxID=3457544 RepID=UPI00029FA6DA|nr:AAA family ATPase [Pseudanabaena sp. PCC 7367]AFY70637.1 hypothetical protein Pse7367_2376 [Pseudanabaena sp. PCC 7367]
MRIKKFRYSNHKENWHIEPIEFDDLNLLVGVSGAGKTTIIQALKLLSRVAKGRSVPLDEIDWCIDFSHDGNNYQWELKSAAIKDKLSAAKKSELTNITFERVVKIDLDKQVEILIRSQEKSKLGDSILPKLKRSESVIALLAEEKTIAPISQGFDRFVFNEIIQERILSIPEPSNNNDSQVSDDSSTVSGDNHDDVDFEVKEKEVLAFLAEAPPVLKAYTIQEAFPDKFNELKFNYQNVFDTVEDIRVKKQRLQDKLVLTFEIKEEENWVPQRRISSGMYRTLIYMVEAIFAPEKSVICIDDFENSLGINCMSDITDFVLDQSLEEMQFIITSHHPYIINNIPWENWQIVSRDGNKIKVRKATSITELHTASSLDKFTLLIDFLEFEDSVA